MTGNVDPLQGLADLQYLDLHGNSLTGDLQLGTLTNLQYLRVLFARL